MKSKLFRSYYRLVSIFWAVIGILFLTQISEYLPFGWAVVFTLSCFIPYYLSCTYLTHFLQPRAMEKRKMNFFVVEFSIASLAMALIFISTAKLFHILTYYGYLPQSSLFDHMGSIAKETLVALPTFGLLNAAFCGFRFYYEHTKLQRVHLESQLQMLQAQVNPHYMFNVLNHIHILMRKDVDKASFLLEKYSEILRYQLYNTKKKTVPLSQEVKFVKDVISIERLRWGNELTVETTWDIEDNWKNIQPLILIVFVENAFKHASRSMSEKGYIKLLLQQRSNMIYMEIENSKWKGTSIRTKKSQSGLGLSNTKERLDILYPKNHSLCVNETDSLYRVKLTINLK